MLKKVIKYKDLNGVEKEREFLFNLSKAELLEMHMSTDGGLDVLLSKIAQEKDSTKLMAMFKDLILRSYGVKSDDGERFIKNQDTRDSLEQSPAYEILFMELVSDTEAAINFSNGILPADIVKEIAKEANQTAVTPLGM